MSSEWMKVMLDEIARKRHEAEQARRETEQRRLEERGGQDAGAAGATDEGADSVNTPPPR